MRPSSASRHGVNDLAIELKITDPAQLLDPGPLRPTTFTFWSSKVLLISVELDLFTRLGGRA